MTTQHKAGDVAGVLGAGGYLWIEIDGVEHRADKLAVLWMLGVYPEGEVIHIDGNNANNSWKNLAIVP